MTTREDDDLSLPDGKTCSDCVHYRRCKGLFTCEPDSKECDWAPSRFKEALQPNEKTTRKDE